MFENELSNVLIFFFGNVGFLQEVILVLGLKNVENEEYSESGRGVYLDGLYRMFMQFYECYK